MVVMDTATLQFSFIDLPEHLKGQGQLYVAGEAKDGELCIVSAVEFVLLVWFRRADSDGVMQWMIDDVIPLEEELLRATGGSSDEHGELKVLSILDGIVYLCTFETFIDPEQVVSQVPNVSNATTQQRQTINVVPQDSPPEFRIWLIPQHPSDDLRTKERPIQLHCNCFACRNKVWVLLNISAREHMSLEEEPVLWESASGAFGIGGSHQTIGRSPLSGVTNLMTPTVGSGDNVERRAIELEPTSQVNEPSINALAASSQKSVVRKIKSEGDPIDPVLMKKRAGNVERNKRWRERQKAGCNNPSIPAGSNNTCVLADCMMCDDTKQIDSSATVYEPDSSDVLCDTAHTPEELKRLKKRLYMREYRKRKREEAAQVAEMEAAKRQAAESQHSGSQAQPLRPSPAAQLARAARSPSTTDRRDPP
ncbi:hypothetical protein EJB05_01818, partial [Eragrostis curvula]